MSETDIAISVRGVSRVFRRYRQPGYRVLEAFGFRLPARAYDEFWALRDISLELRRGDSLGLIGQNGAGKSTLLNIICGRLQASSGAVSVRGTIQALMELGTGFHPEFSGRDNIISALAYQGVTGRAARERLDEIIDFSELAEFIDQPVKTYSSGMHARLAFSTATAIAPDVLIIDEILGAGDAYFAAKCAERMQALTQRTGATLLFVSHDIAAVQRLCKRAVWIDHGRMRMVGGTLDISKEYYADVVAREEARLRAQTKAALARMHSERGQAPAVPDPEPAEDGTVPSDPGEQVATRERWNTDEAAFAEIAVCDHRTGESRHVFGMGDPIVFRVAVSLNVSVPECWLVCVIFDALGNRVSLLSHFFPNGLAEGRSDIDLRVDQSTLRQGEYVVSVELLPFFDTEWAGPGRLPYLCHWDRCLHFKVDEGYHGTISFGLVALQTTVSVTHASRKNDPVPDKPSTLAPFPA